MHGEPAWGPDFTHPTYANPQAPKGGHLTQGVLGTFDCLNPFIVKGLPAAHMRGYIVESLLARGYDEPFTLYGLLADSKKPRRHRLRNLFVLTGAGALAAYFFDPENGSERRTNARRRTSTSARHLANGLDRAAHAAYEAADVAATEPTSGPVPPNARTAESVHRDSVTATH